jgi:hypothetical protein
VVVRSIVLLIAADVHILALFVLVKLRNLCVKFFTSIS